MREGKIEFANGLRGIAAMSVVIVHLCIAFWTGQTAIGGFTGLPPLAIEPPAFALWLDALPISFAAFGVALFFVVSGFVIPISLERYDARAFVLARFIRIWPTYWAGLSVTLVALALGTATFGGVRTFNAVQAAVHYLPPLRVLVYSKPLDGIIWTLEIEFFWYLVAAMIAGPLRRGSIVAAVLTPLALFAVFALANAFTSHPPDGWSKAAERLQFVAIYAPFLIFIFSGVALYFRQRGLIGRRVCAALLAFYAVLFMLAESTGKLAGIAVPSSYFAALALFITAMWLQEWWRGGPILDFLARISYPLYVVHGFAGFVLLHALMVAGVAPAVAVIVTISLAIMLAWAIHRLIELPSHRLAQHASRVLTRRFDPRP